jgi:hypothetical protein
MAADSFKIKYAASATPIESIVAADTTTHMSLVHSTIDKSIGGGKEIACGSTSTNVAYKEYITTAAGVALNDATIASATVTGVDFMIVKIKAAKDAAATAPDLDISLDGTNYEIKLIGVGDSCLLRLAALAGANIMFKSTATAGLCTIDIMWGLEA